MRGEHSANANVAASRVVISRWVNEPYPSLTELLSAHDVARLTRRPRWLILGLALIGQFPGRARFRGRSIGWRRSDVLKWMARDLTLKHERVTSPRHCFEERPRQPYLPLLVGRQPLHSTLAETVTRTGKNEWRDKTKRFERARRSCDDNRVEP